MHEPYIKHRVKMMRTGGASLSDIVEKFHINKSTVSYWCRDIKLKESAIRKIQTKGRKKSVQALLRYSEIKRKERIERYGEQKQGGAYLVGQFSKRDLLMTGLGLYWGEGYKGGGELGFTNSNYKIINFYIEWLKIFDIPKSDLIFRLTINTIFRQHEKEIKNFWIQLLDVKGDQFTKTTIIKTKLKKGFVAPMSDYKGILRVKVRRGLSLKNKILGAINHIANNSKI